MAVLEQCIDRSWLEFFESQVSKPYMQQLRNFLTVEKKNGAIVYPPSDKIFFAFQQTPLDQVKVVIMGQDPYHNPGQAHGLSFSVPEGVRPPPSLQNIFKELHRDLQLPIPPHGCLVSWAKQGVLLLNATLTVRKNEPKSHYGQGWELFTDEVVRTLCARKDPMVFLLWGRSAFDKFQQIETEGQKSHHLILTAPHPSPFSAHTGFFGCSHFSKTNQFLNDSGLSPIDWRIF